MKIVLQELKDDLKDHNKRLESIMVRMNQDIKDRDFDHLARLSVEAGKLQGQIETICYTIRSIEHHCK